MRPLALAALLLPAAAFAQGTIFYYLDFKVIATQQQPFGYYIDGRNPTPAGISLTTAQQATEDAWSKWNAVTCASVKAQSQGLTGATVPNPGDRYDAYSVTPVFATNRNSPDYTDQIANNFITAITIPLTYAGVLVTCDTYLNMVDYTWSTVTPTPALSFDLETVMLHESGHCLGLSHYGVGAVMDTTVNAGENQRQLTNDDVLALCGYYPLTGAAGAPCLADGGCGGGAALKCVTQAMPSGPAQTFCSQGCTTGSGTGSCPLPLACTASNDFTPAFNGACLLPGGNVTEVGKPCSSDPQCSSAIGVCLLPELGPSGGTFWVNGYCSQFCDPGQPPCPAGSTCTLVEGQYNLCLQNCRPGLADCRGDYGCAALTGGGGVCIPRCYNNTDCPTGTECRVCDGLCVAQQNPSAQVGDPCTVDSTCGVGQVCLPMSSKQVGTQCTQQCGVGCGTCPTGSSCHTLERGDLYCMRDCNGPGSCGPGLRCGDTANGKACLPACSFDGECPVGQNCVGGECQTPVNLEDGGSCGTLCNVPDGGRPITVRPDAGSGGGPGTAGCGCQGEGQAPASALFLATGWLVLLLLRRRA